MPERSATPTEGRVADVGTRTESPVSPIRILRIRAKVVFLLIAVLAMVTIGVAMNYLAGGGAGVIVTSFLWIVVVVLGSRWFRGTDEPVEPPRPWWRMTAQPPAGYLLAVLFLLNAGTQAYALLVNDLATLAAVGVLWPTVIALACHGLIGLAYLHSSIRLSRSERGAIRV